MGGGGWASGGEGEGSQSHTSAMVQYTRRKIKIIEGNAKCRHLKKLTCKGTLRQVFLSEFIDWR